MADFFTAVAITLDPDHEGGYQCNPKDKGNWTGGEVGVGELKGTNMGISAAQYPGLDIANLTVAQAESIYQLHYWSAEYNAIQEQSIANKLFDLGVLMGVSTAVKILQSVLIPHFADVVADGNFGPITLSAVNHSEPTSLLAAYKTALVAKAVQDGAQNPAQRGFVVSWIRRINS